MGLLSAFFWAETASSVPSMSDFTTLTPRNEVTWKGTSSWVQPVLPLFSILSLIFTRRYPITHDVERYIKEYEDEKMHLLDKDAKGATDYVKENNDEEPETDIDSHIEKKEPENITELSTGTERTLLSRYVPNLSYGDLSFLDLWINLDFHLIFWPCVLCQAIQFTVIFNMSTYFEAFDMMDQIGIHFGPVFNFPYS